MAGAVRFKLSPADGKHAQCALALHKIASMSSDEADTQTWIDRGTEAYWRLQISEAAQAFEKAVAIGPQSTQARLCFGVACFFLYQNGLSDVHTSFESEMTAELDRIRGLITEQNSTNGKRAEENLQQALHLEPQNKLAMAYLAALYHAWSDSTDPWGTSAARVSQKHSTGIGDSSRSTPSTNLLTTLAA